MWCGVKRFCVTCVAVLIVAGAVMPTMGGPLFYENFTDNVVNATLGASPYTTNSPTLLTANQAVGSAGKILGVDGTMGTKTDGTAETFGWSWSGASQAVNLTSQVMFARISTVSDAFDTNSSRISFFCDLAGTRNGSAVTYYPSQRYHDVFNQTYNYVTAPGQEGYLQYAGGIMVPDDAEPDAISGQLDSTFATTFVWRGATTDGKQLTAEVSGASGTKKTTSTWSSPVVMDHFTGVYSATISRVKPNTTSVCDDLIYSDASGQTDGEIPDPLSVIKVGWTAFEVGVTSPTDFNLDYVVDVSDFNILKLHMGQGGIGNLMTMSQGDANNDGIVDVSDYNLLKLGMGTSTLTMAYDAFLAGNPVPAPGSLALLVLAAGPLALWVRARRFATKSPLPLGEG